MKKILIAIMVLILSVLAFVPGCTGASAEDEFCQSLPPLAEAIQNVLSIDGSTSVDQARQYHDELRSAWNDTVNARKNLAIAKFDELESAYNELHSSLQSISGETTVAEALPSIQAALDKFNTTLDSIRTTTCE